MSGRLIKAVLGTGVLSLCFPLAAAQYDILIRGGEVIDGTGKPAVSADVGIKDGIIVAMGKLSASDAAQVIQADGLVVSPGFIDLHSHAERSAATQPGLENLVQQGITTILGGNCGFSPVHTGEFLGEVATTPLGPNLALLVGHNDVRREVMGEAGRPATEDEVKAMQALVAKAMEEGAFGLSTGLKYVPGVYSDYAEVKALAGTAHQYGGIFTSHMRDEGALITEALEEVIAISEDTGIPVHVSHHKLVGLPNWGHSETTLGMITAAREKGMDVTLDQYPYTASSTRFSILFPPWSLAGGHGEVLKRLGDPATRAKVKAGIEKNIREDRGGGDPERLQIAHFAANPEWDGLTFGQVLAQQGRAQTLANAAELAMEIEEQGGAQGIFHAIDEKDVTQIMAYPFTSVATDTAGAIPGEGNPHPRSYGSYPRVLGRYVREQGTLTLPEAIHKMTGLPAQRMDLTDRGTLAEQYRADIVIFEPQTVIVNATFTSPHQYPTGIEYILGNGVVVKTPEGMTGQHAGEILTHRAGKV